MAPIVLFHFQNGIFKKVETDTVGFFLIKTMKFKDSWLGQNFISRTNVVHQKFTKNGPKVSLKKNRSVWVGKKFTL